MRKYIVGSLFLLCSSFIFSACSGNSVENSGTVNPESEIIFFYGKECPHCKEVEKFMDENKVREKIKLEVAEVYHNKENVAVLSEKAKACGMDEKNIGVPFLWDKGKCYIGSDEIIQKFKE